MTGQRIGYIRVSTFDQNPERQLEGVKVDRAFSDKASGKDVKRPQLEALISFARTGDTVVVHSMDRLARNLDDLRRIVQTLTQRGVHIEFVKEHLSFTGEDSPMANLMLSVMGAFAGTVAKLAMRQPFVLFKGLTFQKLCLPGAFRPGDHHNKMLRPGLCVVHASPQYL
ncbi:recombinase family protein [Escherichia coli]|uniref:recombinase family protein n=8 Tax=Enterobacterales TaxID=91347 RepID=UPI00080908E0|nr:TnpR resolvase [Klebsiella pneumoniae]